MTAKLFKTPENNFCYKVLQKYDGVYYIIKTATPPRRMQVRDAKKFLRFSTMKLRKGRN